MSDLIVATVLSNTIVVGIVAFLAKSLVGNMLSKDLENHKAKLKLETTNAMNSFRSDIEKANIKLQISYGGIFEKQANVILELYQLTSRIERVMESALFDSSEDQKIFNEFKGHWFAFSKLFSENRILLTSEIESIFREMSESIFTGVDSYRFNQRIFDINRLTLSDKEIEKLLTRQDNAQARLEKAKKLKELLTEKLRTIIGIQGSNVE
jgi:hypothetical protein